MIAIVIVAVIMLMMMARKNPKRRRRRLFVPRIKEGFALAALAANTLLSANFSQTVDRHYWAISMDVVPTWNGFTAGEGPLIIGVAHEDYTAAEIEAWLESAVSWTADDLIGQEVAHRKCRIIGTIKDLASDMDMNNGLPIRVKLGWELPIGSGLQLWAYNDSGTALTTGGTLEYTGKAFLRPL